jgi:hypothetical protein
MMVPSFLSWSFFEGATEVQKLIIARELLAQSEPA